MEHFYEEGTDEWLRETSARAICMHCKKRFYHFDKNSNAPQYVLGNENMKCCDHPSIMLNIDEVRKIHSK